jgi:hypothetical protein
VPKLNTLGLRAFTSVSVSHGTSMSLWRLWVRRCSRHVLVQPF